MNYTTQVSIKETNENGYGFECKVSIDPGLPDRISFDIAWQHTDEDTTEDLESVGILMSPEAARAVADRLQECAYRAETKNRAANDKETF